MNFEDLRGFHLNKTSALQGKEHYDYIISPPQTLFSQVLIIIVIRV